MVRAPHANGFFICYQNRRLDGRTFGLGSERAEGWHLIEYSMRGSGLAQFSNGNGLSRKLKFSILKVFSKRSGTYSQPYYYLPANRLHPHIKWTPFLFSFVPWPGCVVPVSVWQYVTKKLGPESNKNRSWIGTVFWGIVQDVCFIEPFFISFFPWLSMHLNMDQPISSGM